MEDLASLGFSVDSSDLRTATRDLDRMSGSSDSAERSVSRLDSATKLLKTSMLAGAAAIGSAALGITVLTKQGLAAVDAQAKLARSLDATTDGLRAVQLAAGEGGLDQMDASLVRLNRRIGAAEAGAQEYKKAISALGLSVSELAQMDVDQRIAAIADATRDFGGSSQEATRHLQTLGFEQANASQFFRSGGDAIRDARVAVEQYGLAVSEIDAAVVEQANDAWARMSLGVESVRNQLAVSFAPVMIYISDLFNEAQREAGGFADEIQDGVDIGVRSVAFLIDAVEGVRRTFVVAGQGIAVFALMTQRMMLGVADTIVNGPSEAVNSLIGQLNRLPGVDIPEVGALAIGERIKQQMALAEQAVAEGAAAMQATLMEPMPSEGIIAGLAEAKQNAEESARANIELRDSIVKTAPPMADLTGEVKKQIKSYRDLRGQLDPVQGAYNSYYKLVQDIADSTATAAEKTELMAIAYAHLQDSIMGIAPEIEDIKDEADQFATAWEEATKRIDQSFASAWEGAFDSFESFADSIMGSFKTLLANLAHQAITKPILISMGLGGDMAGGLLGGTTGGGGYGNLLSTGKNIYDIFTGNNSTINTIGSWLGFGGASAATTTAGYGAFASALPSTAGYLGMGAGATTATSGLAGLGGTATSTAGATGAASGGMSAGMGAAGMAAAVVALPFVAGWLDSYFGGDKSPAITLANMSADISDVYKQDLANAEAARVQYQNDPMWQGENDVPNWSAVSGSSTLGDLLGLGSASMGDRFSETSVETPFGMLGVGRAAYMGETNLAGVKQFLGAVKNIDEDLARYLSVQQIESISESLADWVYDGGGEGSTVAAEVGRQLRERLGIQLGAIDEELAAFVNTVGEGLKQQNLERFSAEAQIATLALSLRDTIDIVEIGTDVFASMSVEAEHISQTIIRTVNQMIVVRDTIDLLGGDLSSLGNDMLVASDKIIQAAGGIDAFAASAASYYQNFYSQAEQIQRAGSDINAALSEIGYTLPNTRKQFREMIESLDLTSEAGQKAYAQLLSLSPALAQYFGGLDQFQRLDDSIADKQLDVISGLSDLIAEITGAAGGPASGLASARADFETLLQSVMGGNLEAFGELERAAGVYADMIGRTSGSRSEYAAGLGMVAADLSAASDAVASMTASGGLTGIDDRITQMYRTILGRDPDVGGAVFYQSLSDGGYSMADIEAMLRSSPEALDGSHRNGLDYVPFDGYRAELHRGESVVTAGGSEAMRQTPALLEMIRSELEQMRAEIRADVYQNQQTAKILNRAMRDGQTLSVTVVEEA